MDMNRECPGCRASGDNIVRYGTFYRRSDARHIPRFRCNNCSKHFSQATFSPCYRQKKRRLNRLINEHLSSTTSMRRIAILLKTSRITVARKLEFLAKQARIKQRNYLRHYLDTHGKFTQIQFDDLETFEHTKCKPVTVAVVVEPETRVIIGFSVAQIAAKGPLAAISRKKYGKRRDKSRAMRQRLFRRLRPYIADNAEFSTDEHQHYPELLRAHFPHATHTQFKSIRGCVTGQGELKKTLYDPLFSVNHTLAMLRANISRLVRKTWCTTKKIDQLANHLAIYIEYHNRVLLTVGRTTGRSCNEVGG